MNKQSLIALATATVATAAATTLAAPAALAGGIGNNSIGPSLTFGSGSTTFGIDGKFGVADNFSIRPFIEFPSGGTGYGAALTYDWDLRAVPNQFTPFLGVGFAGASFNGGSTSTAYGTAGFDFPISKPIELRAKVDVPFSSGFSTTVNVGASFRF
jgi:opacity protein-like surface antigen